MHLAAGVGVPCVIAFLMAVNKIDLVHYDEDIFRRITADFRGFADPLGFREIKAFPISARHGDNVTARSRLTPWYLGPSLLEYLELVDIEDDRSIKSLRLPVQSISRPNADFRGFSGTIASGTVCVGDAIVVLPSGYDSRVQRIIGAAGDVDTAEQGDAVTITLADEIDIMRGDMLAAPADRAQVADQFAAHLVWMSADKLLPGRSYLIKINHNTVAATVTAIKNQIDIDTLSKLAAKTLALNEVGICNLSVAKPVAFDRYVDNRATGAFILIDRYTNETLAAGMIDFALRRAYNIPHQALTVSKRERLRLMNHKPAVLWFTGLSGAGKSTIANLVEAGLHARGIHTTLLDGDNVRHSLNRDLGFTESDRVENIRRIGEVAKLMTDAGLVVLCSFISPFRADRRMVRELVGAEEFIEVFVDTPLETCISRDPKGLYRRALAGEIKNFTGIDQAYEAPEDAELHLKAGSSDPEELAHQTIDYVIRRGII